MQGIRRSMVMGMAVLALGACRSTSGPDDAGLRIRTSAGEYPAGAQVAFTVHNETERVLYTIPCGEFVTVRIERSEAGVWTPYSGDICPAINVVAPAPFAAGRTVQGRRTIADPGVYRLVIRVSERADMENSSISTSNTFVVGAE